MRVVNTTSLLFDEAAFARFCSQELDFTELELRQLGVYLSPGRPEKVRDMDAKRKKIRHGIVSYPWLFVYGNDREPHQVNRTLLHESLHYAEILCYRRALSTAWQRSPEEYYTLLAQIKEQYNQEQQNVPYLQRPCEIRARAFAAIHCDRIPIITLAPTLAIAQ